MANSKSTAKESPSVSSDVQSVSDDDVSDDSSSSSGGDSSSEESSFHDEVSVDQRATEVKEVQRLSRWETMGIRFWRTVVIVLLVIAGILVATGTYIFLRDAEQNDYRNRVSWQDTVVLLDRSCIALACFSRPILCHHCCFRSTFFSHTPLGMPLSST